MSTAPTPAPTGPIPSHLARGLLIASLLGSAALASAEPRPGLTLTILDSSSPTRSAITIGSDGLPVVAYVASGGSALRVAHCDDVACTTFTIAEVVPDLDAGALTGPSITVAPDGFPLVSYSGEDGDLHVARCHDVGCSTSTLSASLHANSGSQPLQDTSITIGADGLALVTFLDADRHWLHVAHCLDADCSAATISLLSSTAGAAGEITVGADGFGMTTYMDSNGSLRTAHCQDVECTLAYPGIIDATAGSHGLRSSIAIGVDGLPLIAYESYVSFSQRQLRVAHCNDRLCGSSVRTVVGPASSGYFDTSVAIGADGLGVVAYAHASSPVLQLVHCGNVACTTSTRTVPVPESMGATGVGTTMTIGTDGLPVIATSYFSELKVAHLANRLGLPYHRP